MYKRQGKVLGEFETLSFAAGQGRNRLAELEICLLYTSFQTWITQGKVGILSATLYMNVPVAVLTAFLFYRLMTINQGRFDAFIYWLLKPFRAAAGLFKRKKETP